MTDILTERIEDALTKFETCLGLGFAYGCCVSRDRAGEVLNDLRFQENPKYDLYKTRYDILVRVAKARVLLI